MLARSEAIYTVLKLAGAGYLIFFLGARTVRDRHALADSLGAGAPAPRGTATIVREGFLVDASNPKGLIIFTAVLPQFIEPSRGHQTAQLLSLGAICVLVALVSDSSWALASGAARNG